LSQTTPDANPPPICDYEGSDYRTRFWQDQGRDYEDLAERIAIRHLLPRTGTRLLEIGTGFGRLVELYQGYEHILLLDYSKSLLREAQGRFGDGTRYTYVAADLYRLPLLDGVADTVTMVRVIHHIADVPQALQQIHQVLRPGGRLLLEFASKHHLKSLLRYAFRRQSWSPFDLSPVEFATLNYDFHPHWMRAQLAAHGFEVEDVRTVSHFRLPLLKRLVPARALAALDGALQWTGRFWTLTPSVFVLAQRAQEGSELAQVEGLDGINPAALFRCPTCLNSQWHASKDHLRCLACQTRWRIDDGIYDFRDPA
jgi:SAM-dependent methyltransferase